MPIVAEMSSQERVPIFVRLPREQAAALDRLAESTGRRKQQVVGELLADRLPVGRAELRDGVRADVLTLEEVAALLRVPAEDVRARALQGDLPGRRLGDQWRFARAAVLTWLAGGPGDADHAAEVAEEGR
jgi:excisionase family DNA binding protein